MKDGRRPDLILLLVPILISLIGLFFLSSASWRQGQPLDQSLVFKQVFWMAAAAVLVLFSLRYHYRFLLNLAWVLYAVTLLLLILVLFMPARLGASRWIAIGSFNIQPSELAKLSVPVVLAALMQDREFGLFNKRDYWKPVLAVIVPALLILKEPDLGTGLLFIPVLLSMLVVAGFPVRWILSVMAAGAAASPFLFHHLKTYQKLRILTFLDPERDPLGSGYTIIQSKIAIGSGGLFGKGLFAGTQNQLRFLPEKHTDFIFSVIGEEGGFIAASIVVLAYWLIIARGYHTAAECPNRFGRLLAVGITTLLATQAVVNICMTLGLLPVVGMPLFMVSYGGSSVIMSLFLIGLIMNIGMRREPFL